MPRPIVGTLIRLIYPEKLDIKALKENFGNEWVLLSKKTRIC